ncbi:MAG TPA: type II toxin-antitoxin system HicB family antitoxin [Candidatus Elarobacter sp.]|jgi:predicted RNase H-like HicB family nuclease|nr:type II toxin-antitoxin system HicB family antitoxin [Candidatus Elarobacter sp.]
MDAAYRVILEPEPNGSAYNAIILAFPTAHTFGSTPEEALANAREVVELEIEDRIAQHEPIPAGDVDRVVVDSVTVTLPAA